MECREWSLSTLAENEQEETASFFPVAHCSGQRRDSSRRGHIYIWNNTGCVLSLLGITIWLLALFLRPLFLILFPFSFRQFFFFFFFPSSCPLQPCTIPLRNCLWVPCHNAMYHKEVTARIPVLLEAFISPAFTQNDFSIAFTFCLFFPILTSDSIVHFPFSMLSGPLDYIFSIVFLSIILSTCLARIKSFLYTTLGCLSQFSHRSYGVSWRYGRGNHRFSC